MLPLKEAAKYLGIKPEALRKRWQRGKIRGLKKDGRVFIDVQSIRSNVHSDLPSDQSESDLTQDTEARGAEQRLSERDFLREQMTSLQKQMTEERRRTDTLIQGFQNQVADLTDQVKALPSANAEEVRREVRADMEGQIKPVLQALLTTLQRAFKA